MDPILLLLLAAAGIAATSAPTWWLAQVEQGGVRRWMCAGTNKAIRESAARMALMNGGRVIDWRPLKARADQRAICIEARSPTLTRGLWMPAAYAIDSEQADDIEQALQALTPGGKAYDMSGGVHSVAWRSRETSVPKALFASDPFAGAAVAGEEPGALGIFRALIRKPGG